MSIAHKRSHPLPCSSHPRKRFATCVTAKGYSDEQPADCNDEFAHRRDVKLTVDSNAATQLPRTSSQSEKLLPGGSSSSGDDSDWEPSTPPLPPDKLVRSSSSNSIHQVVFPLMASVGLASAKQHGVEAKQGDGQPFASDNHTPPEERSPKKSIFDIQDEGEVEALFAQLQELLPASDDDESGSDAGIDDYEARRLRRLEKNHQMLLHLGLTAEKTSVSRMKDRQRSESPSWIEVAQVESESESEPPSNNADLGQSQNRARSKRGKTEKASRKARERHERQTRKPGARSALKVAEDGTTTSVPLPGSVHALAYIFLPPPPRRCHYTHIDDCPVEAPKPPSPPPPSPTTAELPRKASLIVKGGSQRRLSRLAGDASRLQNQSDIGDLGFKRCHQCRRKREETLVMSCHQCGTYFCYTCMDYRYGAYDPEDPNDEPYDQCEDIWNPLETQWVCPKCRGICNCSHCLIKAGLKHLLPTQGPQAKRSGTLSANLRGPKLERGAFRSARQLLLSKGVSRIAEPVVAGSLQAAVLKPPKLTPKEQRARAKLKFIELRKRIRQLTTELNEESTKRNARHKLLGRVSRKQTSGQLRRDQSVGLSSIASSDEDEHVLGQASTDGHLASAGKTGSHVKLEGEENGVDQGKYLLPKRILLRLRRPPVQATTKPRKKRTKFSIKPTTTPTPKARAQFTRRTARQAVKARESQVWVKGAADLGDSDSSLSECDELEDTEMIPSGALNATGSS